MNNFTYHNPTKLIFGKGVEQQSGAELARWCDDARKVLIVYGGGSAERSGLLDAVRASCKEAGLNVFEKGGVRPNPTVEFVRETIDVVREQGISAILAVGGGSVIDTAKAAAMGAPYTGDVWDFFTGAVQPQTALPVCCVLTIPAAGSEQSIRTVISNGAVKTGAGTPVVRPKAALINPELFFTLPQAQIAAGVIDMMSHIMERYFTHTDGVDYTSAQAEAALRTIMRNGLKLMQKADDYDAWAQVGLAGSFAHNGYFGLGHEEDWACHGIEHALSGWNNTIVHGAGLAVVTPAWMRYVWTANPARFVRFATEVMQVAAVPGDDEATVKLAVAKLCAFLQKMHLPQQLSELTDEPVPVHDIAAAAVANGPLGHFKRLEAKDVQAILTSVL